MACPKCALFDRNPAECQHQPESSARVDVPEPLTPEQPAGLRVTLAGCRPDDVTRRLMANLDAMTERHDAQQALNQQVLDASAATGERCDRAIERSEKLLAELEALKVAGRLVLETAASNALAWWPELAAFAELAKPPCTVCRGHGTVSAGGEVTWCRACSRACGWPCRFNDGHGGRCSDGLTSWVKGEGPGASVDGAKPCGAKGGGT